MKYTGHRIMALLLTVAMLLITNCGGQATATRKFVNQLDTNALIARDIQDTLKLLVDLKVATPATAVAFGSKVETFRAANRQLIDFTVKFVTTDAAGNKVLTFTPDGKVQAEQLTTALKDAAQAALNDQTLFPNIPDAARASWRATIEALTQTTRLLLPLLKQLKTRPATTTQINLPTDAWQQLQRLHAAGL